MSLAAEPGMTETRRESTVFPVLVHESGKIHNSNFTNILTWFRSRWSLVSPGSSNKVANRQQSSASDKSSRSDTASKQMSQDLLLRIMNSPIAVGYLRSFCDEGFSNQYVNFYLAVKQLCEHHIPPVPAAGGNSPYTSDTSADSAHNATATATATATTSGEFHLHMFKQRARCVTIYDVFLANAEDSQSESSPRRAMPGLHKYNKYNSWTQSASSPVGGLDATLPDVVGQERGVVTPSGGKGTAANGVNMVGAGVNNTGSSDVTPPSTTSIGSMIRSQTSPMSPDKRAITTAASATVSARARLQSAVAFTPTSPIVDVNADSIRIDPYTPTALHLPSHPHHPPPREFLPRHIRENVKIRMEQYDVWGPEVFAEAIEAVFKIILEDIFPSFKASTHFSRLMAREKLAIDMDMRALPQAHNFHVRPPHSQLKEDLLSAGTSTADIERVIKKYAGKHYTLEEILSEGMLYEEFLSHLEKSYSSDSLVCVRMVEIFKELVQKKVSYKAQWSYSGSSPSHSQGHVRGMGLSYSRSLSHSQHRDDDDDADEVHVNSSQLSRRRQSWFDSLSKDIEAQAWELCLYFVAVGSAYEISIAPKCRDAVMSSLAAPHEHMFAELEASAMAGLSQNFWDYRNTVSYEHMGRRAVAAAQSKLHDKGFGLMDAARAMGGTGGAKKKYPVHAIYSPDTNPGT